MILAGGSSLRDTIPFPKSTRASSLMDGSPSAVPSEELSDLHIRLIDKDLED
jgi:aspartyl-tRNA synthetase